MLVAKFIFMHLSIPKLLLAYLLTFAVFLIIDLVWLGFLAKNLYRKQLGGLLSEQVNWTAAIIFYLLFVAATLFFAVAPAVEKNLVSTAILYGALFGFITYATYDLTNLATLKGWPVKIVWIDMAWGTFLTASVSIAGFYIVKWLQ
jgi:uncharacterized membrane protein